EAMVLLKNTNMTLKEIVAELNFPTATFFCRYFKQHTGFSPNEYRLKSM
ncbi:MAG: helix-turn-helix domain-containing protein, partial [Paludibacteraceae bacterium]|nr:helix-turn-helix domain-containing protein [Paludibacteraceae bacterium]